MPENSCEDVCRLCLQQSELRDSHVLPELLYHALYDARHRAMRVAPALGAQAVIQRGIRERLLCDSCEQRLSRWEDYGARVLRRLEAATSGVGPGVAVVLSSIEYNRFKLFQMSLLWRIAASRHSLFAAVEIGPHQERLRNALANARPGPSFDYGCIIASLVRPNGLGHVIPPPRCLRLDGHRAVLLLAGGVYWIFFVSAHASASLGRDLFLSEDGELRVWMAHGTDNEVFQSITRASAEARRAGRSHR
jgi:hypothetical protein